MKISKEEAASQGTWTASKNPFTKVYVDPEDCPDSPKEAEMSVDSDDGSLPDPSKPPK